MFMYLPNLLRGAMLGLALLGLPAMAAPTPACRMTRDLKSQVLITKGFFTIFVTLA